MYIRRKWFSPIFIFLTFFVIFWDGFLVVWYGMATSMDAPLVFKIFPLIHVAVGLGLTYYVIAGYINKTDVIVSSSEIRIRSFPLPWLGDKTVDARDITQLYTKEIITRNKNGGTSSSYEVHLINTEGRQKRLIRGLNTKEEGLYMEKKIEEYLQIRDEGVSGEVYQ